MVTILSRKSVQALFCAHKILHEDIFLPHRPVEIQRRSNVMLQTDKLVCLKDYAHHPTEINSLLKYAQAHCNNRELNVIFQPHRLSRTKQYCAEFAANLDLFDRPFVVELYATFEDKIKDVCSDLVFHSFEFETDMHDISHMLFSCDKKQLVMFVGAGNILYHARAFIGNIAFGEVEKVFHRARREHHTHKSYSNLLSSLFGPLCCLMNLQEQTEQITTFVNRIQVSSGVVIYTGFTKKGR
jgi:hypothetical protein